MNKFYNFSQSTQNVFGDETMYANFNKLLVDYAKGNLAVSSKEANDKIVAKFREVLGVDENSSKSQIHKAMRRHQIDVYEILEETIEVALVSGWNSNPFFKEWVEVRNLALGDKNEFYITDPSVLSVMKVAGNHHDIIRQRCGEGETKSIETSWIAVKVYAEMERILTGVEDFGALIAKIQEAVDVYINETLFNALSNAASNLGSQWSKTGAMNATVLDTLVEDVSIASGNTDVVIMGTKAALAPIYALNTVQWASDDIKNEKYLTGRFGYYNGIRLLELPQYFKKGDTTQRLLKDDAIYVMPVGIEPMIKLVYEGDTRTYQVTDPQVNRDMTYEYETQTKLGCGVITNRKFGYWENIS